MFLVLALPRSRTYWLSKFLSYGDVDCGHEEARHLRSAEEARIWLNRDYHGSAETAISPFWRLFREANPGLRIATVRRPIADVVRSMMALDLRGVFQFDEAKLTRMMRRLDAKLDQIERRLPDVLSLRFDDLNTEAGCRAIFEHCLPYPFNQDWWRYFADKNLQCSMRALMRHALANHRALERMQATAAQLSRAQILAAPPQSQEGVTFQQEPLDDWLRDGVALFRAHLVEVGESPDNWRKKNIPLMRKLYDAGALHITTARSNGRMFGYVVALLAPSLEAQDLLSSLHTTFYVSKDMPGIGLKLQRASVAALKARGAGEVVFYEGVRGSGPRLGTLYRRMGAQEHGKIYRLDLAGA